MNQPIITDRWAYEYKITGSIGKASDRVEIVLKARSMDLDEHLRDRAEALDQIDTIRRMRQEVENETMSRV